MKAYYLGGGALALLLFIVLFFVGMIGTCATENDQIDKVEDYGKSTVAVRYYTDMSEEGGYNEASVVYCRIQKNKHFSISAPEKLGYDFLGYYSNPDGFGTPYVDKNGVSLQTLNSDILLYPIFEKSNEPLSVTCTLFFENPDTWERGNYIVTVNEAGQADLSGFSYESYIPSGASLYGFKNSDGEKVMDATGKLLDGFTLEDVWNKTLTAMWLYVMG